MGSLFDQTSIGELVAEIGEREVSLKGALELFVTVYMPSRNLSERTRVEYKTDIGQLVAFIGERGVIAPGNVGLTHLQAFLAYLDAQGLSGVTRRRKTASIKAFFGFLTATGVIANNPARTLVPPEREYKELRFLTTQEYRALLKACAPDVRGSAIIELLLQTGLRLSEVARLTTYDVELPLRINRNPANTGSISITSKGRMSRTLPLNYKACRALKAWLEMRPNVDGLSLFVTKFHQPMGSRAIERLVEKYLEEAEIHNASVRTLRHTCATHHVAKGTNLATIRDMLGHADLRSTSIYISAAKEAIKREVQDHAL